MDEMSRAADARSWDEVSSFIDMIRGKTCGDCYRCESPESEGLSSGSDEVGWCMAWMTFVSQRDRVEDSECEHFAERVGERWLA